MTGFDTINIPSVNETFFFFNLSSRHQRIIYSSTQYLSEETSLPTIKKDTPRSRARSVSIASCNV